MSIPPLNPVQRHVLTLAAETLCEAGARRVRDLGLPWLTHSPALALWVMQGSRGEVIVDSSAAALRRLRALQDWNEPRAWMIKGDTLIPVPRSQIEKLHRQLPPALRLSGQRDHLRLDADSVTEAYPSYTFSPEDSLYKMARRLCDAAPLAGDTRAEADYAVLLHGLYARMRRAD